MLSAIVAIFEIPFASGAITAAVRRSRRHVSGALHIALGVSFAKFFSKFGGVFKK